MRALHRVKNMSFPPPPLRTSRPSGCEVFPGSAKKRGTGRCFMYRRCLCVRARRPRGKILAIAAVAQSRRVTRGQNCILYSRRCRSINAAAIISVIAYAESEARERIPDEHSNARTVNSPIKYCEYRATSARQRYANLAEKTHRSP